MRDPIRFIKWAVTIAAVALAVLFVYQVFVKPSARPALEELTFSQSQAVPDFDEGSYRITEPGRLKELSDLLERDGIRSQSDISEGEPGCTGGVSTTLDLELVDGSDEHLELYDCGDTGDAFIADTTALVSDWREDERKN